MKTGKLLWWLLAILVVLFIIAIIVNNSNKNKIASAVSNQNPANPNAVGRFLAVASNLIDRTELYNGKPVWIWSGRDIAPQGYYKLTEGISSGWSVLNDYLNSGKSSITCLERSNAPGHPCIKWKEGTTILEKA